MKQTNVNTEQITAVSAKPYRTQYVVWMCVLFSLLLIGRAFSGLMLYAFVAIAALVFIFSDVRECISFLMFLWPITNILKAGTDSMSFYTLFFFIAVAKTLLKHQKIHIGLLMLELAFLVYGLVFSGLGELTTIITACAGFLLLYYLQEEDIDVDVTVFMFAAGICFASVLAQFMDYLPIIKKFVVESVLKLGENQYVDRFAGLIGNPNYYTMDITIALSAFIVLMFQGKRQKLYIICFIVLSMFGFMSISKSFLISWIILIACWFVLALRKGIGGVAKFLFIATLLLAGTSFFAVDSIAAYISRFLKDSQGTLDVMTTGRTELWKTYISAFVSDVKIFFFGNGLNQTLPSLNGAHNTYIEGLFYSGIVGIAIFLALLRVSTNKILSSKIMWVPLLTFSVRLMAIGIFTNDNLWVYLIIFVCLSKACSENATQKSAFA